MKYNGSLRFSKHSLDSAFNIKDLPGNLQVYNMHHNLRWEKIRELLAPYLLLHSLLDCTLIFWRWFLDSFFLFKSKCPHVWAFLTRHGKKEATCVRKKTEFYSCLIDMSAASWLAQLKKRTTLPKSKTVLQDK